MAKLTRRGFIGTTLAAGAVRAVPTVATKTGSRRILPLVSDTSLGMMRPVAKLVRLR